MYIPDKWMLVHIGGDDPHYRVFGSWYGGYLHGDSWRMNSGITRCDEEGDYYVFHGSSGSQYRCHKKCYGTTAYGASILEGYKKEAKEFTALQECPDIPTIKWG